MQRFCSRLVFTLGLALGLALGLVGGIAGAGWAAPLSGTVLDGKSLAPVPGATITVVGVEEAEPITAGRGGRFRFDDLPPGPLALRIEAEGYEPSDEIIELDESGRTGTILVIFKIGDLGEVIELTEQAPEIIEAPGQQDLRREELTRMPGTRGDALQSIKSLPGVANADAPGSGPGLIVIRGAAPEDSKITIDGVEVPLVYHFFGLQSVLPSEFIDAIDFLPGGFDARDGRSTGGIINIATRAGAPPELGGFVEMSFINFAAFLEGPISIGRWKPRNLTFKAGLRRSLIDFILPAVVPDSANLSFTTAPQYYDSQLRVDWRPNPRHSISSMGLLSYDLLTLVNDNINPNEPLLTGKFDNEIQFQRLINTWIYKQGDFESHMTMSGGGGEFRFEIGAERFIKVQGLQADLREDLRYRILPELQVRVGGEARYAHVDLDVKLPLPPSEGSGMVFNFSNSPVIEQSESFTDNIAGAYVIVDIEPTKRTRISPGLRLDYYDRIDEATLHPRLTARHQLDARWAVQGSIGAYSRNLQQNEAVPTYLEPEVATQYTLGSEYKIRPGISATASAFYTDRRQLVVQDAGLAAADPENAYVNRGYGRSFGAEALVRAKLDDFFGWLAYTISRSDRIDSPLSERRLFDFDQTHVLIVVGSYQLGSWTFGGRWTYSTGNPETPIMGSIYLSDFNLYLPVLGDINSGRLEAAHQLDARIDRKWTFENWSLSAYLDVTNVYANPRTLGFRYNFDYTEREAIEELPLVPALGIRGSF